MLRGAFGQADLLKVITDAALSGLESLSRNNFLRLPAGYRLAFRELGLSIALRAVERLRKLFEKTTDVPGWFPQPSVEALMKYVPLADTVERFWIEN